jgi:hypothetical protein
VIGQRERLIVTLELKKIMKDSIRLDTEHAQCTFHEADNAVAAGKHD